MITHVHKQAFQTAAALDAGELNKILDFNARNEEHYAITQKLVVILKHCELINTMENPAALRSCNPGCVIKGSSAPKNKRSSPKSALNYHSSPRAGPGCFWSFPTPQPRLRLQLSLRKTEMGVPSL